MINNAFVPTQRLFDVHSLHSSGDKQQRALTAQSHRAMLS